MRSLLIPLDQWYRRHLRMCIWKCWKRVKTRFSNLQKCGIPKGKAWEWANTRKGYWRCTRAFLQNAIEDEALRKAGYPMLSHLYKQIHIDCETAVCGTACTVG